MWLDKFIPVIVTRAWRRQTEERFLAIERHFVTKRNQEGEPVETLADVPLDKRRELPKVKLRGASWPQRRQYLEATDGGRRVSGG